MWEGRSVNAPPRIMENLERELAKLTDELGEHFDKLNLSKVVDAPRFMRMQQVGFRGHSDISDYRELTRYTMADLASMKATLDTLNDELVPLLFRHQTICQRDVHAPAYHAVKTALQQCDENDSVRLAIEDGLRTSAPDTTLGGQLEESARYVTLEMENITRQQQLVAVRSNKQPTSVVD